MAKISYIYLYKTKKKKIISVKTKIVASSNMSYNVIWLGETYLIISSHKIMFIPNLQWNSNILMYLLYKVPTQEKNIHPFAICIIDLVIMQNNQSKCKI